MAANEEKQTGIPRYDGIPAAVGAIEDLAKTMPEVAIIVRRKNQKGRPQFIQQMNGMRLPTLDLLNLEAMIAEITGGGVYEIDVRDPSGSMQIGSNYLFRILNVEIEGRPVPPTAEIDPRAPYVPGAHPGAPGLPIQPHIGPAPLPFAPRQPSASDLAWAEGLSPMDRAQYLSALMPPRPVAPTVVQAPGNDAALNVALRQNGELRGELERERATAQQLRSQLDQERTARQNAIDEARRATEAQLAQLRQQFEAKLETLKDKHEAEVTRLKDKHEAEQRRAEDEKRRLEEEKRRERDDALRREIEAAKAAKTDQSESNMMMLFKMNADQQQSAQQQMLTLMSTLNANKPGGMETMMPLFMKMMEARSPEAQAALLGQLLENQVTSMGAMSELLKQQAGDAPPVWLEMGMKGLDMVKNIAVGMMTDSARNRQAQADVTRHAVAAALPPAQAQQLLAPSTLPPQATQSDSVFSASGFDEAPAAKVIDAPTAIVTPAPTNGANGKHDAPKPPAELTGELAQRFEVEQEVDGMLGLLPDDFRTPDWRSILVELHLQSDKASDMLARHIDHELYFGRKLPAALDGFTEDPQGTLESLAKWLPISTQNPDYMSAVIAHVVSFFTPDEDSAPADSQETAQA